MTEGQGGKEQSVPGPRVDAVGHAEPPNESSGLQDAVEYNGGASADPMQELAEESNNEAVPASEEIEVDTGLTPKEFNDKLNEEDVSIPVGIGKELDEDKVRTDPSLTKADKPSFNPKEVQSPLKSEDVEGGVVSARTTGPTMSQAEGDPKRVSKVPGSLLKPGPDMESDSLVGKFEVTGFEVDYESNGSTHSVTIRDYFDDLDAAFMSVNGVKYLMPMPNSYKVSTIRSGAPTISFNERQVYIYKNNKWERT